MNVIYHIHANPATPPLTLLPSPPCLTPDPPTLKPLPRPVECEAYSTGLSFSGIRHLSSAFSFCPRLRLTLSTVAAATSGSAFQFSAFQCLPSAIFHLPWPVECKAYSTGLSISANCCLPRPARVALRAAFGRLPRAAFRAGGQRVSFSHPPPITAPFRRPPPYAANS